MPKGQRTTAHKNGNIATFPKAVQGRAAVYEAPAFPGLLFGNGGEAEVGDGAGIETPRIVSNGQAKEAVAFQGNIKSGSSSPN
jgi:hypothetical protein